MLPRQGLCSPPGTKEASAQWAVRRSRKRPERVNRNKHSDRSKGAMRRLRLRTAPKRSKAAFGGILGPQSGRSLPIVGPPGGETARSPSIQKFSRLCPGKQPRESNNTNQSEGEGRSSEPRGAGPLLLTRPV